MLEVVTKHNAFLFQDALQQMFRLRHRIFVQRMGWEALRRPDGLEKDQFDTEDAIYLLFADDDGSIIGSHRLLPTLKPHLFSELFSEFCDVRGVPVGPRIYELTRTCVDEDRLSPERIEWTKKHIMAGLMEFCVTAGIERFSVLSRLDLLFRYLTIGWDIKPLGVPREIDGIKQAAVIVTSDQLALDAVRAAFRITKPLLHYLGPRPEGPSLVEFIPGDRREHVVLN